LSARTGEQLQQKAIDLLAAIQTSSSMDLGDVAYTLQLGRDAMEERLGFVVNSFEQLKEKLQSYINGEQEIEGFYIGKANRNKEALPETAEKWIADKKLLSLLELWVKGFDLDWGIFYSDAKPKRVCLPSYPFSKERYWYAKVESSKLNGAELIPDSKIRLTTNMESIEDVFDRIGNDSIETDDAVSLLKSLV
jgi:acyl transferase domain-containing protein